MCPHFFYRRLFSQSPDLTHGTWICNAASREATRANSVLGSVQFIVPLSTESSIRGSPISNTLRSSCFPLAAPAATGATHQDREEQETDEESVVILTHTVANEGAMMVESKHALSASIAVL